MRIAILVTDLTPPRIGGISKVATELATNLVKLGHEVDVFCLERSVVKHQDAAYQVIAVKPKWMLYSEYPVVSFSLAAFRLLLKRHMEKPYDVSHAMNFNNYGLTFWKKRMTLAGLAHVSTGFETTQMEIQAKWTEFKSRPTLHCLAQIVMECYLAPWQKSYLGWGEVITTEDIETKEGFLKMGMDEDKIVCIPSGIDIEDIQDAQVKKQKPDPWIEGERVWLCPGRVDTRKGSQYLLRAFAKLSQNDSEIKLVFAGGGRGDYIQSMRKMINELDLQERVLMTGRVEDLYPYYQACEAVIIPSLSEGIPITLQEALAFEKPVLCSKLKGTYHYAKHLKSIIWAEPADELSLLSGLEQLKEKEVSREAISESLAFVEKEDWFEVSKAYEGAYLKAIATMKARSKS